MINLMFEKNVYPYELFELNSNDKRFSMLIKCAQRLVNSYELFKDDNLFYCDFLSSKVNQFHFKEGISG